MRLYNKSKGNICAKEEKDISVVKKERRRDI